MTDRERRAGARKCLSKLSRPSIQKIVVAVERVATGEKSWKVVIRAHEVEIDTHFVRVPAAQIRQTGRRLVCRSVRVPGAEVVCAEDQSVNDIDLRPGRIRKARLSVPHKIEMDLRHHIGADRAVVNGRDIVGIHLVIAGMFFGNVRPKRLLIDACVAAQVVSNTEPVFVGNIPIAFDESDVVVQTDGIRLQIFSKRA